MTDYHKQCHQLLNLISKLKKEKIVLEMKIVDLTEENEELKDARASYKKDWKYASSRCDTLEAEIDTLRDNINGLIEENKELKQKNENYKKFIKAEPIAKSDGEITKVKTDEFIEILRENEQLNLDKTRCHQAMSRIEVKQKQFKEKVFDLIKDKLTEAEKDFKMTLDVGDAGRVEALKELRKELKDEL